MAPRGTSTWRRPYTSIYNDNYKYGTNLYSDTLTDIEKRYAESISKTQLRSDRPDLAFTTFSGSNLMSSPSPAGGRGGSAEKENTGFFSRQISSPSPTREITRSPNFESRLNATLKSAAYELDEEVQDAINTRIEQRRKAAALARSESESYAKKMTTTTTENEESSSGSRPKSLYEDATLWSLPKKAGKLAELDLDIPKSRRKAGGKQTPTTNGPSSSLWRDKSRELQEQVESLEKSMSSTDNRLRSELSSLKARYHTEISDLSNTVETTCQQANDLQKVCKRQANQIQELQSGYDEARRNIEDALDEMSVWQNKCKSLKKEMDRLKEEVEQAVLRKTKA